MRAEQKVAESNRSRCPSIRRSTHAGVSVSRANTLVELLADRVSRRIEVVRSCRCPRRIGLVMTVGPDVDDVIARIGLRIDRNTKPAARASVDEARVAAAGPGGGPAVPSPGRTARCPPRSCCTCSRRGGSRVRSRLCRSAPDRPQGHRRPVVEHRDFGMHVGDGAGVGSTATHCCMSNRCSGVPEKTHSADQMSPSGAKAMPPESRSRGSTMLPVEAIRVCGKSSDWKRS